MAAQSPRTAEKTTKVKVETTPKVVTCETKTDGARVTEEISEKPSCKDTDIQVCNVLPIQQENVNIERKVMKVTAFENNMAVPAGNEETKSSGEIFGFINSRNDSASMERFTPQLDSTTERCETEVHPPESLLKLPATPERDMLPLRANLSQRSTGEDQTMLVFQKPAWRNSPWDNAGKRTWNKIKRKQTSNLFVVDWYEERYLTFTQYLGQSTHRVTIFQDNYGNPVLVKTEAPTSLLSEDEYYEQLNLIRICSEQDRFPKITGHDTIEDTASVPYAEYLQGCHFDTLSRNLLITPRRLDEVLQEILKGLSHMGQCRIPTVESGVFPPAMDSLLEDPLRKLVRPEPVCRYTAAEALRHPQVLKSPKKIRRDFSRPLALTYERNQKVEEPVGEEEHVEEELSREEKPVDEEGRDPISVGEDEAEEVQPGTSAPSSENEGTVTDLPEEQNFRPEKSKKKRKSRWKRLINYFCCCCCKRKTYEGKMALNAAEEQGPRTK